MRKTHKISTNQMRGLVIAVTVGVGILSLPGSMAEIMKSDGWIPILLGGLITIPLIVIVNKIFQLYPDKDLFEIGEITIGKYLFKLAAILYFVVFLINLAYSVRIFAEGIKAFLLISTPIELIIVTFLLSATYLARCEIEIISRAGYIMYPVIIILVLFIAILSIPNGDFTNLLPVFQSDISELPRGLALTLFSYAGFEILLLAIPYGEDKDKMIGTSIAAILIVMGLYLIIFVVCIAQFGAEQLARQNWSALSVIKHVDLPGFFLENLDGVVMALWVVIVFGTIAPLYYGAGKMLQNLFKSNNHELFILPLVPIVYILSLIPDRMMDVDRIYGKALNYLGIFTIGIIPISIYLIGLYRTRGERK